MSSQDSSAPATPFSWIFRDASRANVPLATDGDASIGEETKNDPEDPEDPEDQATVDASGQAAPAEAKRVFNAERTKDEVRKIMARSAPTELELFSKFEFFPFMSRELQLEVVQQVFKKPAIHFLNLDRKYKKDPLLSMRFFETAWETYPKEWDPSSFRETEKIFRKFSMLSGFADMAECPKEIFVDPRRLPIENGPWMDAATDMVCVHLSSLHFLDIEIREFGMIKCSKSLDREALKRELAGIRRVGVMVGKTGDMDQTLWSTSCHLAYFFACFPDLEEAYIVMKSHIQDRVCTVPDGSDDYSLAYKAKTQAQRNALGLKLFYDNQQTYIEFTTAGHYKLGTPRFSKWASIAERMVRKMDETRETFMDERPRPHGFISLQHSMSLERRKAVQFRVMMSSGPYPPCIASKDNCPCASLRPFHRSGRVTPPSLL